MAVDRSRVAMAGATLRPGMSKTTSVRKIDNGVIVSESCSDGEGNYTSTETYQKSASAAKAPPTGSTAGPDAKPNALRRAISCALKD